jgi:hypothetical protein
VCVALRLGLAAALLLGSAPGAIAADRTAPAVTSTAFAAPAEPRGPTQVVVFDRQLRTTTIASHDQIGAIGSGSSSRPSISADGGLIAFQSDSSLVPGDADRETDVYLWDGSIGQVQLVSRRIGGGSNGSSRNPSISGDGSIVAFASNTTNLTGDAGLDADRSQVFSWQRLTGGISLVSVGSRGPGRGNSGDPATSADGRVVAFESTAADLVEDDTNDVRDVFLRDLSRGATIRASVGTNGRQSNSDSRRASVSGDGGAVVFDSASNRLVPRDSNGARDVFVRDLPPAVVVTPDQVDFGVIALGDVGTGSVTVQSVGWTPVSMLGTTITGSNSGDFVIAGDTCTTLTIPYGGTCVIDVLNVPLAEGAREATLEIIDTALDSPQRVALRAGVPAPEFRLEPVVGPPGIVTVLYGTNLAVGTTVNVQWDRGITQQQTSAIVGPDGTLTVQMLVFHHDLLGERQLLITPTPGGQQFTATQLPFLVVAPPLQPPGDSAISYLAPELRLILIRR